MMDLLKRLHSAIKAYFVRQYRIREVARVFQVSHAQELAEAPIQSWPIIKARQERELAMVRAGQLQVVDRKSWMWPFLPASITRMAVPIIKSTPYNLRRMSRTPVPRRAINLIKGAVIAQPWDVRPIDGEPVDDEDEQKERCRIARKMFAHPNNQDSFQTFVEMGLEDMLILGAMPAEMRTTLDPKRPVKMWVVNVESIRVFPSWTEATPDMPRYAQMTGLKGERGAILFYDDEMMYIKDNPSTDNPFGLGKMEVAFMSVNDFLGVQQMAGRSGSDQVHKTWLWWEQPQSDAAYQIVRRHIQNELEGQAKVSIIGGMKKPEVVEVQPTTEQDLLLNWQEILIRMIANAFDMSAMALGVEHDVNRAVGEVLDDKDFRSAVVPIAKRLQEALTRKVLHEKLGWYDLEFAFLNLDDPDQSTMNEMCARMYSGNAITPNEWRKKMGWQEQQNPMYDLSQFEAMMLNVEAVQRVTEGVQKRAEQRGLDIQHQEEDRAEQKQREQEEEQQQLMGLMPPATGLGIPGQAPAQQPGGGGQPGQPGGGQGKTGQPPAPTRLKTPQFPISGSQWNAKQVAQMPVNQLADLIGQGKLPQPTTLLRDMRQQEAGILEEMTEEIKQFFEESVAKAIAEEQAKRKKGVSPQTVRKWEQELRLRYKKEMGRESGFAEWLTKYGRYMGRPGGRGREGQIASPAGYEKPGGDPGNVNPIKRG
jgi:hypothetical protein